MPGLLVGVMAMFALVGHAFAQSDGVGLSTYKIKEPVFKGDAYVYEAGVENAKTIVLIHGLGAEGARVFDGTWEWLAKDYRVVMFDLPGFGRSSKGNALYSPENYAAFVNFVAKKYARAPFILLGHSMGGAIALRYAASFPQDIERLVVVDAAGILHRAAYGQHLSQLGIDLLPILGAQKKQLDNIAGRALRYFESLNLAPETILRTASLRESLLQGSPTKIAALALALEDFSKNLEHVKAPTLIIWGQNDRIAPLRTGHLLAGLLPNAYLSVLDDAGHVPMQEDPQGFRAALSTFLQAQPPPRMIATPGAQASGEKPRVGRCASQPNALFEGEYETLTIDNCRGARIQNARIGQLKVTNASVTIDASVIVSLSDAVIAKKANITMTGGRIEGEGGVVASDTHLDLAGVELRAKGAAVRSPAEASVVCSLCKIQSQYTRGATHGYYLLTPVNPL